MRPEALLRRLSQGHLQNVRFADAEALMVALGFDLRRSEGSHRIYARDDIAEIVDLQDRRGEAKGYQLRQVMRLVERYDLKLEADR